MNAFISSDKRHATSAQTRVSRRKKYISTKHSGSVRTVLQAKLKIGQPNDKYEQEADSVAEQVMRMPSPQHSASVKDSPLSNNFSPVGETIQLLCDACTEEKDLIQEKSAGKKFPEMTAAISSKIQSFKTGGQPLSNVERSFFEPRFGTDFSSVRKHTDASAATAAQSIDARAFTLGNNVVFGAGEYTPDSSAGKKLFAHELTHVVQQSGRKGHESTPKSLNDVIPDSQKMKPVPLTNMLQRECGSREIGATPEDCILVNKPATGRRFLFQSGCNTFASGQRTLLDGFISTLPASASVEILGMASSDGRESFNESLSCSRADATEEVFREAGKLSSIARKEATGEVPNSDYDISFRAVDIVVNLPEPSPPEPEPPEPVEPVPSVPNIPIENCECPSANPSCLPGFCTPVPVLIAEAERFAQAPGLIAVLTGLGGLGVGSIYTDFVFGGRTGVLTLSSSLRDEFAEICQTKVATHHIMEAIINSIWGRFPASTGSQTIPLSAVAASAVNDIGTPGNAHALIYCGSGNAPGLLAGGIGTTQTTVRVGANPSTQNDARTASGHITVSSRLLPSGGTRIEFIPTVDIEVKDTVDFCPGNCGSLAAQVATNPLSRWEASGISGDVAFVTKFPAPRTQLRKIVLQTVGGVSHWSLESV